MNAAPTALLLLAALAQNPARPGGPRAPQGAPPQPKTTAQEEKDASADAPSVATDDSEEPEGVYELPLDRIPLSELSGEARAEAERILHERLEEEYFLTCDGNGNGWISFREGRAQLRMDRIDFFRFDANADGRITREEFGARYKNALATTGSFRPPTSASRLFESDEDSPLLYDFNSTGALEEGELKAFLADKSIDVPLGPLMEMLDKNRSKALEPAEFQGIIATLTPLLPAGGPKILPLTTAPPGFGTGPAMTAPTSVFDLFGARTPRKDTLGNAPLPDYIAGPISHFRRLDYDNDGFIEEQDLAELLRPAHVDVRATAVLAALDTDGDGRLSEAELDRALGD